MNGKRGLDKHERLLGPGNLKRKNDVGRGKEFDLNKTTSRTNTRKKNHHAHTHINILHKYVYI